MLQLVNLGYTYIPRKKITEMRESNSQYILRKIAFDALRKINGSDVSDKSIQDVVFEAEHGVDMGAGMVAASEQVFSLLLAGKAVSELIDGRRMSPQMKFAACQMLYDFTQKFDADKLRRYQRDLKKFIELKKIQKTKNAETVDFSKYEDEIRRILDKYVSAEYVTELTKPVCVSESAEFNAYIDSADQKLSDKSKAEAIAAQTKRTIKENYNKDPEFYRHFSEKIEKLIEDLRNAKAEDAQALLQEAHELQGHVVDYEDNDIPSPLRESKLLHPYYRSLRSALEQHALTEDQLCATVQTMIGIIEDNKIIDWHKNVEVKRRVRNQLEDYLFDAVETQFGIALPAMEVDRVVAMVWDLAVQNRSN